MHVIASLIKQEMSHFLLITVAAAPLIVVVIFVFFSIVT